MKQVQIFILIIW